MLKIRLKRVGRKGDASFRLIVTESTLSGQSNKYIDILGSYNPRSNQKEIDAEKAKAWIAKGAQASDTAYNLLVDAGAIEGRKKNALPKKTAPVKEVPVEQVAAPVEKAQADEPASETSEEVVAE